MKNIFGVFIIVLISWSGCASSRNQPQSVAQANDPDSLVAYIERTRCFGICPYYSIRIYRSGYVLYEGYEHVPNIGRFYTFLDKKQLESIGLKALETGYFELNDEYRNPYLTDYPTVYTTVKYKGKSKSITHYDADPPENLVEMEKFIDSLFPPETAWQVHPVQEYKD
jgi:hypothetical protein